MGPPGGGKQPVTNRFLRHFNFLSFSDMNEDPSHTSPDLDTKRGRNCEHNHRCIRNRNWHDNCATTVPVTAIATVTVSTIVTAIATETPTRLTPNADITLNRNAYSDAKMLI